MKNILQKVKVVIDKRPWLYVVSLLILLPAGLFGYNKYLDWQNYQEIEELVAAFEQLERDVEAETGEDFYIETACDSLGGEKFSNSYNCAFFLLSKTNRSPEKSVSDQIFNKNDCKILVNGNGKYKNSFQCLKTSRPSNTDSVEKLVFDYDTTPGRTL